MNEIMTMAEINERFPCEWVLLVDPQKDTYLGVQSGALIWHSKDREEVYCKAIELPSPKNIAVFYTGPVPEEGMELLI